ncbi:hypothetical protein LCGC14_2416350, partial [marine sediment metagenome]
NTLVQGLETKEIRYLTKKERRTETGKRVAIAEKVKDEIFKDTNDIDTANAISKRMMAGKMPAATFEAFSDEQFSRSDWKALRLSVFQSDLLYWEQDHATSALHKLEQGLLPTVSEMGELSKVLGERETLVGFAVLGQKQPGIVARFLINMLNAPTTLKTTFDISLTGRQGWITAVRYPKEWTRAFITSHKVFWGNSEAARKRADLILKDQQTRHYAPLAKEHKVRANTLDGGIDSRQELFHAQWLKKVPYFGRWVAASERAAVVGMNQLRNDIFDSTVEKWEGQNKTSEDYDRLAKMVNISTGVGHGKKVQDLVPYLNAPFFSFSYNISRFQLIGEFIKSVADPAVVAVQRLGGKKTRVSPVSPLIAAEVVAFVGAGLIALTIAEKMGAEVEWNPESSDFLAMKFGRQRIDVWAGFRQISVMVAQLATGKGKSLRSGEIYTKSRLATVLRFVQGKLAPLPGLGVEILNKKTFLGEPLPDEPVIE